MKSLFYLSAGIAVISTVAAITRFNVIRALLYLIVSLLSVAVIFFILGAPFSAALEVIIYAGSILVLFVFAVILLNSGAYAVRQERKWLTFRIAIGPAFLALLLLVEVLLALPDFEMKSLSILGPKEVGGRLFGPYMVCVELASVLLLSALVGALYLGSSPEPELKPAKEKGRGVLR